MKIFISWSGDRSRAVAELLADRLPFALYFAEPWLSDKDIGAGKNWFTELSKQIQQSAFGIVVTTPENLSAPWLLFETGALSNAFSIGGVCPYLVDLDAKALLKGPLSQFQAKKAEKKPTLDLVQAINNRATQQPVPVERLRELFETVFWPSLEAGLESLRRPRSVEEASPSPDDIVEELVESIRRMETRLDSFQAGSLVEVSDYLKRPLPPSAYPITIEVIGQFPGIPAVTRFQYTPRQDLIQELAEMADVEFGSYGVNWVIHEPGINYKLSLADGVRYMERTRRQPIELLLVSYIGS